KRLDKICKTNSDEIAQINDDLSRHSLLQGESSSAISEVLQFKKRAEGELASTIFQSNDSAKKLEILNDTLEKYMHSNEEKIENLINTIENLKSKKDMDEMTDWIKRDLEMLTNKNQQELEKKIQETVNYAKAQ